MRVNTVKQKLADGGIPVGVALNFYAPPIVEILGALDIDWVFIDCEHGSMDPTEVEHLIRASEAYDIIPMARVEENRPSAILRLLDRGMMGVMAPHVATREDAELAVHSSKFWPVGERSTAGGYRANNYGVGKTVRDFYEDTNREVMVIALVESVDAVENIDDIASVDGLDCVWIGPSDLAQSMGMPPQDEVDSAIEHIIRRTRAAGKASGVGAIGARDYDRWGKFIDVGVNIVQAGLNDFIRPGAEEFRDWMAATKPI